MESMQVLVPLLVMAVLVGAIAGSVILLSSILGPKRRHPVKDTPFECGIESEGMVHTPFSVKFYLVALLFILFDVELAFLFPWAVVFRGLGWSGFVEMFIFVLIVGVGFVYAWKMGALEWQ